MAGAAVLRGGRLRPSSLPRACGRRGARCMRRYTRVVPFHAHVHRVRSPCRISAPATVLHWSVRMGLCVVARVRVPTGRLPRRAAGNACSCEGPLSRGAIVWRCLAGNAYQEEMEHGCRRHVGLRFFARLQARRRYNVIVFKITRSVKQILHDQYYASH